MAGVLSLALAQSPQHDQKQLEAQARQLIAEGKALEQQGKLAEAKDKYVDAAGLAQSSEALSAISRISERQERQVDSLLAEAQQLFEAGKFSDSANRLEQALTIQPERAVLHYDLALCYLRLGDRTNAALHLDPAIALAQGKERTALLELRSTVLLGTAPPPTSADASKALAAFNDSYLQADLKPADTRAARGSLCTQATTLATTFPANPAVMFNSAKCAAEDGRAGDAARLLVDYTRLAPEALDQADAAAAQRVWSSLASLPEDSGRAVRSHYAAASGYLDARRYNLAIAEYEAAAHEFPDFPQTEWELAVLYEAYGDTAKAAEHFARFEQLAPEAERKAAANTHVSTFERRRALYDADVSAAEDILSGLIRTTLGIDTPGSRHKTGLTYMQWRWASQQYKAITRATAKLPQPYVTRELDRAREQLLDAIALFSLGVEANELLALIDLQDNDWSDAYIGYDTVASQGLPVSFYAQVQSTHDGEVVHAAKIEITGDAVRLIYLSSYDPKSETSSPPAKPAGADQLGNLILSAVEPTAAPAEAITLRSADLAGIETDQNFVVLRHGGDKIYIAPLNMAADTPYALGTARAFGNAYTTLFVRYFGYQDAKLGTEGWTAGEKFRVGLLVAGAAMPLGMVGLGASVASSAARAARVAHAARAARAAHAAHAGQRGTRAAKQQLADYKSIESNLRIARAGAAADHATSYLQIDPVTLERTAADQQRAIEGMVFKFIPTKAPAQLFQAR